MKKLTQGKSVAVAKPSRRARRVDRKIVEEPVAIGIMAAPTGSLGKGNDEFGEFTRQIRHESFHVVADEALKMVAVNKHQYSGAPHAILPELLQLHWNSQLSAFQCPHPDIMAATNATWDSVGLNLNGFWTGRALSLQKADFDLCRAVQAALFQTWNTSEFGCDFATAVIAIGCFLNAHPAFRDFVRPSGYELPYGDDTAWALCRQVID